MSNTQKLFDYSGAVHIHSEYSFDGNTPVTEIAECAGGLNLDFLIITDHFRLDTKKHGLEGYLNGVLVIAGEEITPRYNHYIALGIENPVLTGRNESNPQKYIDEVNNLGGFGLIAHPHHKGAPKFGVKDYPWKDWAATGYKGLGIWDLMTDWQETLKSLPSALKSLLLPTWSLKGAKKQTLGKWDELNKSGKYCGYGEIDNHNTPKKYGPLKVNIFPFAYALKTIRTHILLEQKLSSDAEEARSQVLGAFKKCRLYVSQDKWNNACGFYYSVKSKEKRVFTGDEIEFNQGNTALKCELPKAGIINVINNGSKIYSKKAKSIEIELTEIGVYRIEAKQKIFGFYKPWIYSNPIWVR